MILSVRGEPRGLPSKVGAILALAPRKPPRRRSFFTFFLIVAICTITILVFRRPSEPRTYALPFGLGTVVSDHSGLRTVRPCSDELEYLRRAEYDLSRNIKFQKVCLEGVHDSSVDRDKVSDHDDPLLDAGVVIDLEKRCSPVPKFKSKAKSADQLTTCSPVKMRVPHRFPKADLSNVIFGVATSYERLLDSMGHFGHWLANSNGTLLAVIVDQDVTDQSLNDLARQYRLRNMNLLPIRPSSGAPDPKEQHFTLIRDMLQYAKPSTLWGVIIDDDTFFPSPYSIARLLETQDPAESVYLGGLSEDEWAIHSHGVMAFGGAGVFMSMPLLEELEPYIDTCIGETEVREGDGLLRHCVYTKTNTSLTVVPELHQIDMMGDISGFYESGRFPLSLHHWKSWHHAPVDRMARISDFCGSCFLQRWRFGGDTVLSNGFSISAYQGGIKKQDLNLIEGTWDHPVTFEDSMGPLRDKTPDGLKKTYTLIDSEKVGKGFRQLYVFRGPEPSEGRERMDEVVEVYWEWPSTTSSSSASSVSSSSLASSSFA